MSQPIGAIAAGHPETARSAAEILKDGGNAFDAVVAAHITACVVEPVLASFAGGGFLLSETASGKQTLYDFFVQTPLNTKKKDQLNFFSISADFGTALQEFHIGFGSVATPGTVKGLFTIHRDLCSMPFARLAENAIRLARNGVEMNAYQAGLINILSPLYLSNHEVATIYKSLNNSDELIQKGEILKQPLLADFIEELVSEGEDFFYRGEIAESVSQLCSEKGGHLKKEDFLSYELTKRRPLKFSYRNTSIAINPPPSTGGLLIAFALQLMETVRQGSMTFGSANYLHMLAEVQALTNKARIEKLIESEDSTESKNILEDPYLRVYKEKIRNRFHATQGTTQISIIDAKGNMASLTTSNGTGSGVMIPKTGVMLNNMLGEEDLNILGFYNWPEDQRISSMMAPAILHLKNGTKIALGSGGSNRLRTAILQVLLNLVDFKMSLVDAIQSPRLHYEKDLLNVEAGFSSETLEAIRSKYPNHKFWNEQNLFFGGTHAVAGIGNQFSGFGDPRRGGVSIVV